MHKTKPALILAAVLGYGALAAPALAELKAPRVGTHMVWDCDSPYTNRYDLKVVWVKDEVVRYEGKVDDTPYFAEKHRGLTGTSLWYRLFGDRAQWFDMEDFVAYRQLFPGSRFKAAVPARDGAAKWVWSYEVSVGQPRTVTHAVMGKVRVVPVSERRKVFHGDCWSRMTTQLVPEQGISLGWTYEDPKGIEKCDLVLLEDSSS